MLPPLVRVVVLSLFWSLKRRGLWLRKRAGGKLLDLLEHGDNLRFADIGVVPGLLLTGENWSVSKIPGWYPEVKSSLRRAFCFSAELKLAGEGHFFTLAFDVSAQPATPSLFGGDSSGVA